MDRNFEIEYRDEQIQDLRAALAGTKRETGKWNSLEGKWEINYSSILTKLIQQAGRWCEYYASDLFILWEYNIKQKLDNGTIENGRYTFAFRENGVDNREKNSYYYRAVWFLDVTANEKKIELVLHK